MIYLKTYITVLALLLLAACNSCTNADEDKVLNSKTEAIPLADSLIPENVKIVTDLLDKNGIKILKIASSKWSLFGNQGIWLKTDKGVADIITYPKSINSSKLQISPLNSESEYSYELKYNDSLLQTISGNETFFVIGKYQIYKSTDKQLIKEIEQVESN